MISPDSSSIMSPHVDGAIERWRCRTIQVWTGYQLKPMLRKSITPKVSIWLLLVSLRKRHWRTLLCDRTFVLPYSFKGKLLRLRGHMFVECNVAWGLRSHGFCPSTIHSVMYGLFTDGFIQLQTIVCGLNCMFSIPQKPIH